MHVLFLWITVLHFWGAEGAPILFSEIGFCVASCSYIYIYRSGYWSGNRTFSPVAIGPAIGHVVKHQSDSCYIYAFYNAFCAISSVQSDSGISVQSDIFSPVGSILAA